MAKRTDQQPVRSAASIAAAVEADTAQATQATKATRQPQTATTPSNLIIGPWPGSGEGEPGKCLLDYERAAQVANHRAETLGTPQAIVEQRHAWRELEDARARARLWRGNIAPTAYTTL